MAYKGEIRSAFTGQETIDGSLTPEASIRGKLDNNNTFSGKLTTNNNLYEELRGKPKINGIELVGNKTGKQLSLIDSEDSIPEYEIDQIIFGGLG